MNEIEKPEHKTVLLSEAVDALVTDPDGFYIDGTFGRGGHTAELLSRLSDKGRVLAIDKDPQAIAAGLERFADDSRLQIVHGSFADMGSWLEGREVSGVLVDLGVSSPQLDQAERGFSFMRDGPLDMRMDTSSGMSAADWLASAPEAERFVRVGDRVEVGQVVCIIESMKMMNEITAEHAGVCSEILVDNGQAVESGQALIALG